MVPLSRNKERGFAFAADGGQKITREMNMPRGDKSAYSEKQKRKAEHIEEGYEDRGVSHDEAERRAWATVNKESGGGKKSGSGRGKSENRSASRKGGRLGGRAAASRSKAAKSRSAKKAAKTRKRKSKAKSRKRRA
jgi:plasmid stabilization system protein ParE